MRSACQLGSGTQPPCTPMKARNTYRLVRLFVLRNDCATKRKSRLFRSGCEHQSRLAPRGERAFVTLRYLICLFVFLSGLFLALLVTANSRSDLMSRRFSGPTQKQGPFPTIQLEQVVSGLTA